MRWIKTDYQVGDMLRISVGRIFHYGVYIGDDKVVQFGEPPIESLIYRDNASVKVCVASVEEFSCGRDIEVAFADDDDNLIKRRSDDVVKTALSRVGEGGYSIIHNNCEHFAYECVYGVRRCTQTDGMRNEWRSRPKLGVYIKPITNEIEYRELYPIERDNEIKNAKCDKVKKEKFCTWDLLEYAICDLFLKDIKSFEFSKNEFGKWSADGIYFSLSHCDGYVAVAVSNEAIGVDIENADEFERKIMPDKLCKMKKHILAENEDANTSEEFLSLWTKKESIFKCCGDGYYHPTEISVEKYSTKTKILDVESKLFVSICSDNLGSEKIYLLDSENKRTRINI